VLSKHIRYALRGLWHSKGFAIVAILCLGFGIGVNTTLFSVMDGVILKPYPYPDPDRILVLGTIRARDTEPSGLSYLDMRDWNAATTAFTSIAAVTGRSMTLSDGAGEPERYLGAGVSWDLFPMLGTFPIHGQGFTREQDAHGGGGVVLLSHDLWTRRFRGDPAVLGRTVLVNAKPHVVVGVMPPKFAFPNNQRLWVPLTPLVENDPRGSRGLFAFGRLKPGVGRERATQELEGAATRVAQAFPATNEGWRPHFRTLREAFLPQEVSLVVGLMMAGATIVLFIACSNVANLLLARAGARRREISLRTALGASRGEIVKQLLTEGVVLNLLSVPLGVGLAHIGTRLIASAMPPDQVPYYITWSVDPRSLGYTIATAVGTALVFGLFPALQVTRGNLHDVLKEGTRGNTGGRSRLRSVLVGAQVALALVCLVGALMFVQSFRNLEAANVGFDTSPLMTLRYYLTGEAYDMPDARLRRMEDIVTRVEALPGVRAAFGSSFIPLSGGAGGGDVIVEGRPVTPGQEVGITFIAASPGFTRTLDLAPVRGRDFTRAEGWTRSAVALVNQSMAARLWPDGDVIGHRFRMGYRPAEEWFTVIGIIPDAKLFGVEPGNDQALLAAFVPFAYQLTFNPGLTIRVAGDPAAITGPVRAAIRASDPNVPLAFVRTMDEVRRLTFWAFGLYGWIFGTIGVVGLLLASVGVYGVLAYSVSQRTAEIGVRVALGASRRDIVTLVVRYGVMVAGIGILVGLVLAPAGTYVARQFFFQISPFDPVTFGSVAAALLAISFLASYLPARRALKVDPIVVLRGE
jgi:putative ABC transport system permease protein